MTHMLAQVKDRPSVIFCSRCGMWSKESVSKEFMDPCPEKAVRFFALKRLKKSKSPYWVPGDDAAFSNRDGRVDNLNAEFPVGDPRRAD